MTGPDRPPRKQLFVTPKVHEAVSSMQKTLARRWGVTRVTQDQAIRASMEALSREMEAGK